MENRVTKGKGTEKKKAENDVVINIGLMEWSDKDQELKRKRGKRLPLRVSPTVSYLPFMHKAEKNGKISIAISTNLTRYIYCYMRMGSCHVATRFNQG
jgi:hypothetical protein